MPLVNLCAVKEYSKIAEYLLTRGAYLTNTDNSNKTFENYAQDSNNQYLLQIWENRNDRRSLPHFSEDLGSDRLIEIKDEEKKEKLTIDNKYFTEQSTSEEKDNTEELRKP